MDSRQITDFSNVAREGAAIRTIRALVDERNNILDGRPSKNVPPRLAGAGELAALDASIKAEFEETMADYLRGYKNGMSPADAVLAIVRRGSVRPKVTGFDVDSAIEPLRQVIADKVRAGAPIPLFLPVGGDKAPAPLKTAHHYLPDTTEDILVAKLAAMSAAISSIHAPGAKVLVMPDAPLHSADLGFSFDRYGAHLRAIRSRIQALGLEKWVNFVDTTRYLPTGWHEEVFAHAATARARFSSGDELFRKSFEDQVASLVYSLNTRAYSWDFSTQVLVNSAIAGHTDGLDAHILESARHLLERTRLVTPHYIGVNAAIRSMGLAPAITLEELGSSAHVRLTVHAKPGEPRPALAQANEASRPFLLPMHSLPLRFLNKKGLARYASVFELEAVVNSWRPVLRQDRSLVYYEPMESEARPLQIDVAA